MKQTLTLAALIAATLALGACSNAPHAADAGAAGKAGDPTSGLYGSEAGHMNVDSMTSKSLSSDAVASPAFAIPKLGRMASASGAYSVDALFHVRAVGRARTLLVSGDSGEVVLNVSAKDPADNNDYTYPERLQNPPPMILSPGWYRLTVTCITDRCTGVKATLDGKPVVPFAAAFGVVATAQ